MTRRPLVAVVVATVALAAACTSSPDDGSSPPEAAIDQASSSPEDEELQADSLREEVPASEGISPSPSPSPSPSRTPAPTASEPPDWYRQRLLEVTDTGFPAPQETPEIYRDRRLVTVDNLPPPPTDEYVARVQPIPDEIVPISTWEEGCPTTLDELRYLTVSYWGFDELHHTGELIVHRDVAEDIVWVFEQLHEARFPIEQMDLLDDEDFTQFHRHGDDNITAAYQCRATTGSSRWSQHAFGRAIDINPFHNPYWKVTGVRHGLPRPRHRLAGHDHRGGRGRGGVRRDRLGVGRSLELAQGLATLLGQRQLSRGTGERT